MFRMVWRLLAGVSLLIQSCRSNGDRSCVAGMCKANANGTHLLQTKKSASMVSHDTIDGMEKQPLCEISAKGKCEDTAVCVWGNSDMCHAKIAWLHIPKAGGSFGTTLAHFANSSLPEGAHIPGNENLSDPEDLVELRDAEDTIPKHESNFFCSKYPVDEWFKDVFWHSETTCNAGDHASITDNVWREWKGRFFGMFRQPEERMVSAFNYFANGTGDIVSYARRNWGLQTKMLADDNLGYPAAFCAIIPNATVCEGRASNESAAEGLPVAVERLRTGFAFVGLTSEWDLSICLFHRMFGGDCLPVEFANMRAGQSSNETVDVDESLELVRMDPDPWDGELYKVATEIFWRNVRKYDVRRSTCRKTCDAVAHLFQPSVEDDSSDSLLMQWDASADQDFEYSWPGRYVYIDV